MFISQSATDSAPALYDTGDGWLDYGTLRARVAKRAASLAEGKKLAFCLLSNSASGVIELLALLEAGHAVALLDSSLPDALAANLFDAYAPDLILGIDCPAMALAKRLPKTHSVQLDQHHHLVTVARTGSPLHPELSLLLSTSGSTGSPKFVRLSRRNITANAQAIAQVLALGGADRILAHLPMYYSFGFSVISSHLVAGASIVPCVESLASAATWKLFRREGCTSLPGVPSHFEIVRRLDVDRLKVPTLGCLLQAGGRMSLELIQHFAGKMAERNGRLFVMYGQTEASPRMTTLPASQVATCLGSVGPALPGGRIEIRGLDGQALPAGEVGEVVYFGPNVMMGYAASRADLGAGYRMEDGLHTGDLGRLDAQGYLTLTGRANRVAKIHGVRVSLDEVEAILASYGSVAAASPEEDRLLVVVVQALDTDEIHGKLVDILRLTPSSVVVRSISALPIKANGKIDYDKLAMLP